jgi:hypothetical protein
MSKKYLYGLKENGLQALRDQGMLVQPIEQVLHENVMPWMLEKVMEFLGDDDLVDKNVDEVANDAYDLGKYMHSQSVIAEYKRRND